MYPDYLTLFTSAGPVPNDNETVFAIQNKGTTDNLYGMPLCTLYGTRGSYGGGRATCMPSVTLADMYEEKDGQKFNWNNYIPGYNESDAVKKNAMKVPYIIQNINHKQYLCRLLSVKDEGYTAALCIESLDKSLQEGELFSTLEVEEIEE